MFLSLKRTLKEALKNFFRNGWLTIATVSVVILSLYVVSVLHVVTYTIDNILKGIQSRVNVSVYFKPDVSDDEINGVKEEIQRNLPVKSVEYISKEQALEDFKRNNASEPAIIQSLDEIGDNPLLAALVIKADSADRYEFLASQIEAASFSDKISRVNYAKNKDVINRLNNIVANTRKTGIGLAGIFSVISILVTFNTIRLTIYTLRKEIEVMRLVGASNAYIRMPFIIEGIIYGFVASVISMAILFLTVKFAAPYVSPLIPTEDLINFYVSNMLNIFGIQLGIGIFLGVFSSLIAMRKYLKI